MYLSATELISAAVSGQHVDVLLTTTVLCSVDDVSLTGDVIAATDHVVADHSSTTAMHAVVASDQRAWRRQHSVVQALSYAHILLSICRGIAVQHVVQQGCTTCLKGRATCKSENRVVGRNGGLGAEPPAGVHGAEPLVGGQGALPP